MNEKVGLATTSILEELLLDYIVANTKRDEETKRMVYVGDTDYLIKYNRLVLYNRGNVYE